ncbi:hypothetical protein CK203_043546 [Vitis vinifera]|uniref:Uncharacterized protein n=1 Tax=Vitis vinifera TaxID=29760 RepID=A0A438HRB2_VITVI|nr:hypothetical protein CK203_043546 [Vitis vinifera]
MEQPPASKMGVRKLRLLLHMLFFFSSSLSPSQTRLVSGFDLKIDRMISKKGKRKKMRKRVGGGGEGG